jgi:uncharacterized membrane protein
VAHPAGHPAVYDTLVALHVVSAVVGFGAVAISGAYGTVARRDPNGDEIRRYFAGPIRAEYLVLVVPFLGAAAMGVRPGGREFGDLWVIAGAVIWVIAAILLLKVVRPAEAVIRKQDPGHRADVDPGHRADADPGHRADVDPGHRADADPGHRADMRFATGKAGTRLMWSAAVSDALFVAALLLMVTQPA